MINFTYKREIEDKVLNDYVRSKKSKAVFDLIKKEIEGVPIDIGNSFLKLQIKKVEYDWNKVKDNFYKKLGDFYQVNISDPNIFCYLTRLDIFPYNYSGDKKWFSAPMFGNPAERLRAIMHELCHYFQPVKLSDDIKEAIPVILNDHDNFMMYGLDKGHKSEEEQKWRKIIWDLYKNGKRFNDLLDIVNK